jgi:hypothetical protein
MTNSGYVQTLAHRKKCSIAKKGKSFEQIYGVEGAKDRRRAMSKAVKTRWKMKKGESVNSEINRLRIKIAKLQKRLSILESYELRKRKEVLS